MGAASSVFGAACGGADKNFDVFFSPVLVAVVTACDGCWLK
jgi:hypothetical protein